MTLTQLLSLWGSFNKGWEPLQGQGKCLGQVSSVNFSLFWSPPGSLARAAHSGGPSAAVYPGSSAHPARPKPVPAWATHLQQHSDELLHG